MGDPGLTQMPTLRGLKGRQRGLKMESEGSPQLLLCGVEIWGTGCSRASGVPPSSSLVLPDLGPSDWLCFAREPFWLLWFVNLAPE